MPQQIVATITAQRSQGLPLRKIAEHLNSLGVRTPRGNRWHPETVSNILEKQQEATA